MITVLTCGCEVDSNTILLCDNCREYLVRTGAVIYNKYSDREKITQTKRTQKKQR